MNIPDITRKTLKACLDRLISHPDYCQLLVLSKIVSIMSSGVVANNEAEKIPPSPTEQTDAAAAEPAFADQSTRLLPPSKIVIVSNVKSTKSTSGIGRLTLA
jgi:hypothetical protein